MDRKLASIQRIVNKHAIANADKIEVVDVLGWQCVSQKGNFSIGDLCVYIEVDSVFPDLPEFADFRKRSNRLKTIRLRGQISQGVCLPMSCLVGKKYPNDTRENPVYEFKEGDDVSALLGITKWEPEIPAELGGEVAGVFPSFIPKTDETRIQAVPGLLERHHGKRFYATEKLDGSSCTIYYKDGHIGICGRNYEFKETTDNSYRKACINVGAIEFLKKLGRNIALQGELIGPGINGSRKFGLTQPEIRFFNIYDIDKARHLPYHEMSKLIDNQLPLVPLAYEELILTDVVTIERIMEMVKGTKSCFSDKDGKPLKIEGLVFRPYEETQDPEVGRLSFKAINPEYLLENEA